MEVMRLYWKTASAMNENGTAALRIGILNRPECLACAIKWKPMDHEENEPKLFSLSEAERARREVEPLLIEAMEGRRKAADLDEKLSAIANRILIMGGITIDYESVARLRSEHNRLVSADQGRARSNSGHRLRGERPRHGPGGFSGRP